MNIVEARKIAIGIAEKIVEGRMPPYDGALWIWKEILDRLDEKIPDDLWIFKSNASAIEDCRWNFESGGSEHVALTRQLEQEILSAAKALTRNND